MAEIRPFRGIRYNLQKIPAVAKVICPPYDIISPELQDALYAREEHNFVRIEFNKESPADTGQNNRYTRAAGFIADWLRQNVLVADEAPALYYHLHYFTSEGTQFRRGNLTVCARLEEWDSRVVRPHENIIPRAKSDRMSMLRACNANTSDVLAMYEDPNRAIYRQLQIVAGKPPLIDFVDAAGERHQFWVLSRPEEIRPIQAELAARPLYIADGHHRYDSALTYRREIAARTPALTGEEGSNFVMMSLIDFADPGMIILPTHRLVKGIPVSVLNGLRERLQRFFDLQEVASQGEAGWQPVERLAAGGSGSFAVCGLVPDRLLLLTLRDAGAAAKIIPASHGDAYRKLEVSLVDHVILEGQLGYNKETENLTLAYTRDRIEAVSRVRTGEFQLAFILNPLKPETIKEIADAGDRMPRKSTYFFPKSPAGLVFYRW